MTPSREQLRWAALGAAVVALVLAAVAARSGSSHPIAQLAEPSGATHSAAPPPALASVAQPAGSSTGKPYDLGWVVILLLTIVGIVVAVLLYRLLRRRVARRIADGVPPSGNLVTVPDTAGTVALIDDAVTDSLAEIDRGPVTDAVIACWVRVEGAATEAGIDLRAADTSREFAERVLGAGRASAGALNRLAALYREARFSSHSMDENAREQARACLLTIRDDLHVSRPTGDVDG